jgi:6-phosphogluconolactonase/glucosamine-6-phosphate isomerase/deaminase
VSVHNAQILAQSQRLAEQLGAALTSRAVIDQALGILMSRTGATPDEAFDRLRAMSQSEHVKVSEVARLLVDEAVHRARAAGYVGANSRRDRTDAVNQRQEDELDTARRG